MKRLVFKHIKACFETGHCEVWESNEISISDKKPVFRAYGITQISDDLFECYDISKLFGTGQRFAFGFTLKHAKQLCKERLDEEKEFFKTKETK